MRTENSIKNISMSIATQIIIIMLGFISRKVFINNLGTDYLGVNGVLTSILGMLSLIEGGVGTSIVYNLYKPLAEANELRVSALVNLYKKIYTFFVIVVFILSLLVYPFLEYAMGYNSNVQYIGIVYFIFVFKNMISYLNAHKWSLINADQKGYVLTYYNLFFQIFSTILKIFILLKTQNYIMYLLIEMMVFVIQNLWNGHIVNKRYCYIKKYKSAKVDKVVIDNLITNVKSIFLHSIGGYFVFGTDNLLISSFVNLKTAGLYSNYTLIINQLEALVSPFLSGVGESIGNLLATTNQKNTYPIFKVIYLVNFWIYSIVVIFLFNVLQPFIIWFFGEGLLIDSLSFILVLTNFYLTGMRKTITIFKSKAGLFSNDKYLSLVEAFINLVLSLILVNYLGLAGVFLGTTLSTILVPLWAQAKIVYNRIFEKSFFVFLRKYIEYFFLLIMVGGVTTLACNMLVNEINFLDLIGRGILCLIIPNIIYICYFYNTKEFSYLLDILLKLLKKLIKRVNYTILKS